MPINWEVLGVNVGIYGSPMECLGMASYGLDFVLLGGECRPYLA